jgi:hypothetical protein
MSRRARFVWSRRIGSPNCAHHYHYWFHTGEAHAVRQMLGQGDLLQVVGDMSAALYRPE